MAPAPDSVLAHGRAIGQSTKTHLVHLLWSAWIFITPLFSGGYSWRWAWITLLSYPIFLLLYARTLTAPRREAFWYPLGMIAMCVGLLRWYPEGLSYFIFGCVMLRVGGPQRTLWTYVALLLALNAGFLAYAFWLGFPWQMLVWLPPTILIIGIIVNVERASEALSAALRLSHDEVRRLAATAERERIGRDLHDLLGHTLSLITLKLELARKLSERDPGASRRELADAERVARSALPEVRSALTGIRSTDLAAELASARLMLESSQVHLDYEPPPDYLPQELERGLSLVLREAATNITRHAGAGRARILFTREGDVLQLLISDDGRGGINIDGNGLAGMRERVRDLGGTMSIESPRGRGTRLLVRVPIGDGEPAQVRIGNDSQGVGEGVLSMPAAAGGHA
ncbi:MAG: sensor histidine kinase [Pseudomonadota bacterium]|nr:sensor histidine kinase [Pseudomonadota bacterium]